MKYFLKEDIVFKNFFTNNKKFLVYIIKEIIGLEVLERDITIINNDEYGDTSDDKYCVVDLAVNLGDKQIIIEMQNVGNKNLEKRFEYYMSKKTANQLKSGKEYSTLTEIYGIFFINDNDKLYNLPFTILEESDKMYPEREYGFKKKYIFNLTKLDEPSKHKLDKEFIYFLKFIGTNNVLEMNTLKKKSYTLDEAIEILEDLNKDEALQNYMDRKLMYEADQKMLRDHYIETSTEEGLEKGIKQGIEQGIEQRNLEIAKNLLEKNINIDIISTSTGLSVSDIEKLRE